MTSAAIDVDVAVLGTGPAGSATALRLARLGWRVALIGRAEQSYKRLGETLAPANQPQFKELKVWERFLALEPMESLGTESLWGSSSPREHTHFVTPYASAWHVDRERLDTMLVEAALTADVLLLRGSVGPDGIDLGSSWHLTVRHPSVAPVLWTIVKADFLVDATGRRAQFGRWLGAVRFEFDRLVGVGVDWGATQRRPGEPLVIESVPEGWWYAAPVPGRNITSTILMTDADLAGTVRQIPSWDAALKRTDMIETLVKGGHKQSRPVVHDARSHRLQRFDLADPKPWIAVGDSSLAVDPVSGSGVWRALSMAAAAAKTIDTVFWDRSASRDAITSYENDRDEECTRYLEERAGYYAAERRFNTPFWARRSFVKLEGASGRR